MSAIAISRFALPDVQILVEDMFLIDASIIDGWFSGGNFLLVPTFLFVADLIPKAFIAMILTLHCHLLSWQPTYRLHFLVNPYQHVSYPLIHVSWFWHRSRLAKKGVVFFALLRDHYFHEENIKTPWLHAWASTACFKSHTTPPTIHSHSILSFLNTLQWSKGWRIIILCRADQKNIWAGAAVGTMPVAPRDALRDKSIEASIIHHLNQVISYPTVRDKTRKIVFHLCLENSSQGEFTGSASLGIICNIAYLFLH